MFIDVNECSKNNGECQHECLNTAGSYHCRCYNGFVINLDGRNCTGKLQPLHKDGVDKSLKN